MQFFPSPRIAPFFEAILVPPYKFIFEILGYENSHTGNDGGRLKEKTEI